MYRFMVKLFCLLSVFNLTAQPDFSALDKKTIEVAVPANVTVELLSQKLASLAVTDTDKVRVFYVWIAHNIAYDYQAYKSGNIPEQSPQAVLEQRKAVCQGYSELFYRLCKLNHIPCYVITGYSKGFGYKPGKKFTQTDHAWNAVKLNGKWYLIDVTWAAGYLNANNAFVKQFNEAYFLTLPEKFIFKHLPADPMWQLLPNPIDITLFSKDSVEIKRYIEKLTTQNPNYTYADTLTRWETLDSVNKKINSAARIIRTQPDNGEAWYQMGWFYFQLAWEQMQQLNNPNIQKNKSVSVPLAQKAIQYQKEALKYLEEAARHDVFYKEEVKNKKTVIQQNLKTLEHLVKM